MPRQRPELRYSSNETSVHSGVIIQTISPFVSQFNNLSPLGQERFANFLQTVSNPRLSQHTWEAFLRKQEYDLLQQGIAQNEAALSLLPTNARLYPSVIGQVLYKFKVLNLRRIDQLSASSKGLMHGAWADKKKAPITLKLAEAWRDAARDFSGLPFDDSTSTYLEPKLEKFPELTPNIYSDAGLIPFDFLTD